MLSWEGGGEETGPGLLLLLGLERGDTLEGARRLLGRLSGTALFCDGEGRIRLPPPPGTPLLVVPNFTLPARFKGRVPDFGRAMPPGEARPLFARIVALAGEMGFAAVGGPFGARMGIKVDLEGPVTYNLEA